MKNPTALLVSEDADLVRFLSEAVHSTGRCDLEVVPCLDDAHARAANDDLAIVIVHLRQDDDISEVGRLREDFTKCGSPAAVLIVCDGYRPSQARDALLFGAIDYLPRPLEFNQVAFLIEMQVLRILRRLGRSTVTKARAGRLRASNARVGRDVSVHSQYSGRGCR